MRVEVPDAEVADRLTILELKLRLLPAPRRPAARAQYDALMDAWIAHSPIPWDALGPLPALRSVNARLWQVEDALREHEARQDFGARFVELARSVYRLNDERAALKAEIAALTGSRLVEQKSYSSPNDS